ncbi:unnamed protein product [Arabis nemorensis]|uniref:Uncharacterized protein n=1 Tax=Arabis nemorensis TaxID=586526 RepID=A0A565ANP3_9BRAS|nr:unnamed protein product [Arabis nemorensis]
MEDPVKKLTDLKKLTLENQKLMEEMRTLTRRNRTSLDINAELYKLQAENQKLTEEVLSLTKKNNTLLAFQSKLYEKAIAAKMSKEATLSSQTTIDHNVEFGEEETWIGRNPRDGVRKGVRNS